MKKVLIFIFCLLLAQSAALAQDHEMRDTLRAAVKTDHFRVTEKLGEIRTDLKGIRSVVSPLGEGDPIRWTQSLPGVTTGADGSTAIYVRGGNMGNNLFSVDGVPVYGYTHLLGLTTVIPQDVIESVSLKKGGFIGSESNFTSSHLGIETRSPGADKLKFSTSLNNFLVSASAEAHVTKDISFMLSGRISPLTYEYRLVKDKLPNLVGDFKDFSARVGDLYGKFHWQVGKRSYFEVSGLGSMDSYSFVTPEEMSETMGWNNAIGILRFHSSGKRTVTEVTLSANRYGNSQEQSGYFRSKYNHLSLVSDVKEYNLSASLQHTLGKHFSFETGMKFRYAMFSPGQVASVVNSSNTLLAGIYLQGGYYILHRLTLKATVKGNYFMNLKDGRKSIDPEASLYAKWDISKHIALETTIDKTVQYYHTLEGMPVGWSIDMMVPSGNKAAPEGAVQGNLGTLLTFGKHSISLSSFYKKMDNLIYYKYSQSMFSGALATWEDDIDIGKGTSYGTEFLYEYAGNDLYTRVSYTLSKTTREGFASIYNGAPFHARFDRTHVLNTSVQWHGFSAAFSLQSGHWENGAAETYTMHVPGAEWTADYYSGVNNYHMPTVIRLDLGYEFSFKTGRVEHDVNLGICNVLNHFNPFMIYYDTSSESWKEMALLPILPNFSYRINF